MNAEKITTPDIRSKPKMLFDLFIALAIFITIFIISERIDIFEQIVEFTRQHENWDMDEIFTALAVLPFIMLFFSVRRWREAVLLNHDLKIANKEIRKALSEIKTLKSILPICASCKKIRDDAGYWHHVESYINAQTGTDFSHGICPECMEKLYPELVKK